MIINNDQPVNESLQDYRESIKQEILKIFPNMNFENTAVQTQLVDAISLVLFNKVETAMRSIVSGLDPRGVQGYFLDAYGQLFNLKRFNATNLVLNIDVTNNDTISKLISTDDTFLFVYNGNNYIFDVLESVDIESNTTKSVTIKSEKIGMIEVLPSDTFELVAGGSDIVAVYNGLFPISSRDIETDEEFLSRIEKSKAINGDGSKRAIESAISSIPDGNIKFARVFDRNDLDEDGVGIVNIAGAIKCLIGGIIDDGTVADNTQQIAEAIYSKLTAGVYTIGDYTRFVTLESGQLFPVRFSAPDSVIVDIQMRVLSKSGTAVPLDFLSRVESSLGKRFLTLDLGEDVYYTLIWEGIAEVTEATDTYVLDVEFAEQGLPFGTDTVKVDQLQIGILGQVTLL